MDNNLNKDPFEHFDNCPSGENHVMVYKEEWTGSYWRSYNKCARCRRQIKGDFADEARKIGRDILEKNNINLYGE